MLEFLDVKSKEKIKKKKSEKKREGKQEGKKETPKNGRRHLNLNLQDNFVEEKGRGNLSFSQNLPPSLSLSIFLNRAVIVPAMGLISTRMDRLNYHD